MQNNKAFSVIILGIATLNSQNSNRKYFTVLQLLVSKVKDSVEEFKSLWMISFQFLQHKDFISAWCPSRTHMYTNRQLQFSGKLDRYNFFLSSNLDLNRRKSVRRGSRFINRIQFEVAFSHLWIQIQAICREDYEHTTAHDDNPRNKGSNFVPWTKCISTFL